MIPRSKITAGGETGKRKRKRKRKRKEKEKKKKNRLRFVGGKTAAAAEGTNGIMQAGWQECRANTDYDDTYSSDCKIAIISQTSSFLLRHTTIDVLQVCLRVNVGKKSSKTFFYKGMEIIFVPIRVAWKIYE